METGDWIALGVLILGVILVVVFWYLERTGSRSGRITLSWRRNGDSEDESEK